MAQTQIEQVQEILRQRYPDYSEKPAGERVLLAMSVLALDIKVREATDKNDGPWVKAILKSTSLGEGYAWCAASIEFCAQVAKAEIQLPARDAAGVINWKRFADKSKRRRSKPQRGRLCGLLHSNGTGHIGIVAGIRENGDVISYEGNTTPGPGGNQRDGGGCYRRIRKPAFWQFYIELDESPDVD